MRPCTKITSVQIFARNRKRKKHQNATFEGMKPNVPEFFRIGIRFERIPGRSASLLQKWRFDFLAFLLRFFDSIGSTQHTAGIKICPNLHRIQGRIIRALDNKGGNVD